MSLRHLLLIPAAFLAVVASAQVDPARTVVVVNGEEIKGSEYYRRMEFLSGVGKRMGNVILEFPPGFLTLEQLITERLVFQLAKQKGVTPTDLEVQAEYNARLADQPNLMERWKEGGRTEAELMATIRYDVAQFKLATYGVTITDQEVEKHYKDNQPMYTIPKRAKLRVIAVETEEDQKAVDADLAAGKKFSDVAAARSVEASKADGGYFGEVDIVRLGPALREPINNTKIGKTTGWILTDSPSGQGKTRLKFLVEGITPAKVEPLDAKLKRRVRRWLMVMAAKRKNIDVGEEMRVLRAKAKIDIKDPQFADAYKKFIDAYLKQGGGTPTAGGS